mmetsp:Transcript_10638/g.34988  ORF Transcript_10638/g.34988 Transcript_10638/m.34988 type:complete len:795 (-) Transcript_10638:1275-3659(-)
MCTIEKLAIKGIRSFAPDNTGPAIEFQKPLTLIVGRNGSGKTTIIESLKMACTGDVPPHTGKGHGFIHDPKVAQQTEVKAQIKLQVRGVTGKPFVVVKSFQLKQRANKPEFKALDQTIQTYDEERGEKVALSKKCADINVEVPALMGVSKAVLENVIFVHQDDSNWPLSDPAVLKGKFDDIFAATKYTKALDAIKKLRQEKQAEVKEFKSALKNVEVHKDQAATLRTAISQDEEKMNAAVETMEQASARIEEANAACRELQELLTEAEERSKKSKVVSAKRDMVISENARRRERLQEEAEETLDQLVELLESFEENVSSIRLRKSQTERELNDKRLSNEAQKERYSMECKNQGRLQAESDAQVKRLEERRALVARLANEHPGVGVAVGGSSATEPQVAEFAERSAARLRELHADFQAVKAAGREHVEAAGRRADAISERLAGSTEVIKMKRDGVARNEARIQELGKQMAANTVTEVALANQREICAEKESALAQQRAAFEHAAFQVKLQEAKLDIHRISDEIERLRQEQAQLSTASEAAAAIRQKRADRAEKEAQADDLIEANRQWWEDLFGVQLPPKTELCVRVRELQENKTAELRRLETTQLSRLVLLQLAHADTQLGFRRQLHAEKVLPPLPIRLNEIVRLRLLLCAIRALLSNRRGRFRGGRELRLLLAKTLNLVRDAVDVELRLLELHLERSVFKGSTLLREGTLLLGANLALVGERHLCHRVGRHLLPQLLDARLIACDAVPLHLDDFGRAGKPLRNRIRASPRSLDVFAPRSLDRLKVGVQLAQARR